MEDAYKILNLIATTDEQNIELAHQLLQPHLGTNVLTELYLIYFVTQKEPLQQEVRTVWESHVLEHFSTISSPGAYLKGGLVWKERYSLSVGLKPLIEAGVLEAKKLLYFFERLLGFKKMDATIKSLFMTYGSTEQVKALIYACKIKNLLNLDSLQLTRVPAPVLEIKGLRRLNLSNNALETLPDNFFSSLPDLTTLLLDNNQINHLSENLKQSTKLQKLDVSNNQLTALPEAIGQLIGLKHLNVANNYLEEMPDSLVNCTHLEHLYFRGNELKSIPSAIAHFKIKSITGIKGYDRAKTNDDFLDFIDLLQQVNLYKVDRENIFHLFVNNKKEIQDNLGIKALMQYLTFSNAIVQSRAMAEVLNWPKQTLAEKPLEKGAAVFLLGETRLKKKTLQSRIEKKGLVYHQTLQASTTHVVVGLAPQEYDIVADYPFIFLTEQDLNQYLKQEETPYLLVKDEDSSLNKAHVKDLLLSTNEGSKELGVELLKAGGVPRDLITALLFVAKTADKKETREQAKKILKANGSASVQKAVADRSKLVFSSADAEKKVFKNLVKLAKKSSEINWTEMGWYLHQNFGNGLRYTFDYEVSNSPLRQHIINALIQDNRLDFFTAYAGYRPDYTYFGYAYYEKTEFPIEILHHTALKDLDCSGCRIAAVPVAIDQLSNLEQLNLSGNFINALPDSFKALQNLKKIDLSDNEFPEFPAILQKMPWLESITLKDNRKGPEHYTLSLPTNIKESLPNTTIVGLD